MLVSTRALNTGRGLMRVSEAGLLRSGGACALVSRSRRRIRVLKDGHVNVCTDPIRGPLKDWAPVRLELVSHSEGERVWNELVERYHYLGYRKLLGHRLKYLGFIQDRPVAALSWSAPALKLLVRDRFIGWSEAQRTAYLHRIASNSRFLVLPWVEVPHLASHVLARNMRRLAQDWREHFQHPLWLLETFVDPRYFQATCYRAANWIFIGITQGSRKQGRGYVHHGAPKEVYVYVLNPQFRALIGCTPQPYDPFRRPPRFAHRMEALEMILRHGDWSPDLVPSMDLTAADLEELAEELVAFHTAFHDCFGRVEHQRLGLGYLSGLLSNSGAKSVEPIALERLGEGSVRSLQRFLKSYGWDHEAMEQTHVSMLAAEIASEDGMINVDSCEFVKKGRESVGVARQYCGAVGKVDNCQSGVFVGYSSDQGYGLLTAQLYMPAVWFTQAYEPRRNQNLVPPDLRFQTKPQIALGLIEKIVNTNQFPARWIGCDAVFGSDWEFLESLPKSMYYFASVRSDTPVFLDPPNVGLPPYKGRGRRPTKRRVLPGEPQPQTVADVAQSSLCAWTPIILAEGAKGPIVAEVARLRVYPCHRGLPKDRPEWLFLRRTPDGTIKYALSDAPETIAFSDLCKVSMMRWPIEQCFQDGKGQVGMDHYEHRSWPAWHRHMIYVFLALHFLHRLRVRLKKNPHAHRAPGPPTDRNAAPSAILGQARRAGNRALSHSPQLPSVSLA